VSILSFQNDFGQNSKEKAKLFWRQNLPLFCGFINWGALKQAFQGMQLRLEKNFFRVVQDFSSSLRKSFPG
jgi:hypothetical protein